MQQVNLYLPELRPQKLLFGVSTILFAGTALFVMLVAYQLFLSVQLQAKLEKVEELENQQVVARQRLDIIRQAARPKPSTHLDKKLSVLKSEVTRREKLELFIGKQKLGNSDGFAHPMNTLAAYSNKEIALERIKMSRGGALLEMKGQTSVPDLVPEYLKELNLSKPFSKTQFGQLSMAKMIRDKHHHFSLGFEPLFDEDGERLLK